MKILVLGDIHGRTQWEDIVRKHEDEVDKVVFLGDYVTTHEGITSKQQVDNFLRIKDYKESNPEKVIILFGNHDCQMMGLSWAECSGWSNDLYDLLCKVGFKDWMMDNAKVAYLVDGILFTHAGVTKTWLAEQKLDINGLLSMRPDIRLAYSDYGYFNGRFCLSNPTGDNVWQSPIWVRPNSLIRDHIDGYDQVVGHTPVKWLSTTISRLDDLENKEESIYLCDTGLSEYLIIDTENKSFYIRRYEEIMRMD